MPNRIEHRIEQHSSTEFERRKRRVSKNALRIRTAGRRIVGMVAATAGGSEALRSICTQRRQSRPSALFRRRRRTAAALPAAHGAAQRRHEQTLASARRAGRELCELSRRTALEAQLQWNSQNGRQITGCPVPAVRGRLR